MTNKGKEKNILREMKEELSSIYHTRKYLKVPKINYRVIILIEILYQREEQLRSRDSCFINFPWKKMYLMT